MVLRNWLAIMLRSGAAKAASVADHISDPALMNLRRQGLPREAYHSLNQKWLRAACPRAILDIGANTGQFAVAAHAIFPEAAIYSFEPLPDCFAMLRKNMSHTEKFRAFNLGLGAARAELEFNRSSFAPSSSFRKMATLHTRTYPWTAGGEKIRVQVEALDTVAENLELPEPILLKLDVQGFEDQVLLGGQRTVRRAAILIVETSFETLYEGQPLFGDIYRTLTEWGFAYKGSLEQSLDPATGRALFADSVFLKRT